MHSRILFRGGVCLALAILAGCGPASQPSEAPDEPAPAMNVALKLIVVDDPAMASAIERQWKARESADLTVIAKTWTDIATAKKLDADAIIYPSGMIGELAERKLILPLDNLLSAAPQLDSQDVLEQLRIRETLWGGKTYAVAFGSPTLTLMYRPDIFEKLQLKPPSDWEQYRRIAERLSDRDALGELAPPAEATWRGTLEPLGPGWAGQTLLARSAPYARHRSQYSTFFNIANMTPRIDGPPFLRALDELLACAPYGPAEAVELSPADVRREFLAGRCGMALAWPTAAENDATPEQTAAPVPVAFAEIPGAVDVYNHDDQRWEQRRGGDSGRIPLLGIAGRLGSVATESAHHKAALAALATLTSSPWDNDVSTRSAQTTLFRASQIDSASNWVDAAIDPAAAAQYAEIVAQTMSHDVSMFSPRLPGRERYLTALDTAVHQAVAGDQSAAETLQAAAAEWRTITDELGQDRQKAAYRRSVGMER